MQRAKPGLCERSDKSVLGLAGRREADQVARTVCALLCATVSQIHSATQLCVSLPSGRTGSAVAWSRHPEGEADELPLCARRCVNNSTRALGLQLWHCQKGSFLHGRYGHVVPFAEREDQLVCVSDG